MLLSAIHLIYTEDLLIELLFYYNRRVELATVTLDFLLNEQLKCYFTSISVYLNFCTKIVNICQVCLAGPTIG